MSGATVSCVIPMYQAEAFVAEAIESVLAQTVPPDELIVVDDGSTDGGPQVAASYGAAVTLLSQANAGPSAARDAGVREATGSLIAFLDADDVWLPEKLEAQAPAMAADPPADVVLSRIETFIDSGSSEDPAVRRWMTDPQIGCVWSTGLFRADCFDRFGGLASPDLPGADRGIGWFAAARGAGLRIAAVDRLLARRRLHSASRSVTGTNMDDLLDVLHHRMAESRGQ